MGKVKTHSASRKRFTLTKLGLKNAKRKRHLRSGAILSESVAPTVRVLIGK